MNLGQVGEQDQQGGAGLQEDSPGPMRWLPCRAALPGQVARAQPVSPTSASSGPGHFRGRGAQCVTGNFFPQS